jgi:flagellar motor switch protein FliN/FliY
MITYLDCWAKVARDLFAQALAGEPGLTDALPKPLEAGSFGFAAIIQGEEEGRFAVEFDGSILETPLFGDGVDQKAGWGELLRETFDAAAGELLASSGKKCRVSGFEPISGEAQISRAFQLKFGEQVWTVLVHDEVRAPRPEKSMGDAKTAPARLSEPPAATPILTPGLELLLDVELEASLRFGCREMPLGEILDLGPGDVVELDRHVSDPVDLIVGDKIVARGEVVLVNGNFGLRVTEVAAPRKRLESIRCLF